jgi:hypothetical protein
MYFYAMDHVRNTGPFLVEGWTASCGHPTHFTWIIHYADYEDLRALKLTETVYPAGVLILCAALGSDSPKEESLREAIPEFLRHNIVENGVRNIA